MKGDFLKCGVIGWCMEIIWTGFHAVCRQEWKMTGQSSLWMFPIYGCGTFILPLSKLIKKWHIAARGLLYAILIFAVEFSTGRFLWKKNSCPWDYSRSKWNISHVIRLDYAPVWFGVGLLFEKLGNRFSKNTPVL